MKYFLLKLAMTLSVTTLFAQWIPVNNGLSDYPPTALCAWVDTMVVSTYVPKPPEVISFLFISLYKIGYLHY
jgi:hypothetical protein